MDFPLDANMPRGTGQRIAQWGHKATDVRDIGLGAADDDLIAAHARSNRMCLISRDFDFADVRNYPPNDYFGIVVLDLPNETSVARVFAVLESALANTNLLSDIVGKLAVVDFMRVRMRVG